MKFLLALIATLSLIAQLPSHQAWAQFEEDSSSGGAESSGDGNLDPFSDYSEFDEGGEEESDINFFHNGRFFSIGAYVGAGSFTESYGQLYKPGVAYGGFLTYFFDLRFALQVGYGSSDHLIGFLDANTGNKYTGKISLSRLEFDLKYFINTQNVSRGLAKINPYVIGGFSRMYRVTTFESSSSFVRDDATGFQGGMGVEFPLMNNRVFLGAQAKYHFVSFSDEGREIQFVSGSTVTNTGIFPTGDFLTFVGMIGINF